MKKQWVKFSETSTNEGINLAVICSDDTCSALNFFILFNFLFKIQYYPLYPPVSVTWYCPPVHLLFHVYEPTRSSISDEWLDVVICFLLLLDVSMCEWIYRCSPPVFVWYVHRVNISTYCLPVCGQIKDTSPTCLASWIGTIFIRIFIGSAYFDGRKVPINIDPSMSFRDSHFRKIIIRPPYCSPEKSLHFFFLEENLLVPINNFHYFVLASVVDDTPYIGL